MRIANQPAWVLHLRPWRESSAIVELFTRDHGRLGVVARGIRGARRQPLRAALQPLSLVSADFALAGELGQLRQAEALMAPLGLSGDRLMAGFYLAELVIRLLPRQSSAPALFESFGHALAVLADRGDTGWALRRFERDLLIDTGMTPPLDAEAGGAPLEANARYRVDPEQGVLRQPALATGSVPGAALLALSEAGDGPPDGLTANDLRELRLALRGLIAHQLGARGLRSWDILRALPRSEPSD